MVKCPYCDKEAKPRGLKNHVRLSTGDGHGDKGEIPDDYDGGTAEPAEDSPEEPNAAEDDEADSGAVDGSEAAEVTAEDLTTAEDEEPDTGESGPSDSEPDYPFDPEAEGAIRLDGDEDIYVRHNGKVVEAKPDDGDYLLITDDGPILWDHKTDDRFEVVTA